MQLNNKEIINDSSHDFTSCKISIYHPDTNEVVASSVIKEHNKLTHTISITLSNSDALRGFAKVSLSIFTQNGFYHFMGTVRKTYSTTVEIALYHGTIKEDRTNPRFDINSGGTIDALVIDEQFIKLRKFLYISVLNISASGALVRTSPDTFFVGTIFRANIEVNGDVITTLCEIIRLTDIDSDTCDYGCKFIEDTYSLEDEVRE